MLTQLIGLLLWMSGFHRQGIRPAVLGDQTIQSEQAVGQNTTIGTGVPVAGSSGLMHAAGDVQPTLRVLVAVMTKAQEDAFQKERTVRENALKPVIAARITTLETTLMDALHHREQEDVASHAAFLAKVNAFRSRSKKQAVLAVDDRYRAAVTTVITTIQKKLESMATLLDNISIAAAAAQKQGKDISRVDSDITAAQAKVTTALTRVTTTAGNIPTTVSVTSESSAGADVSRAVAGAKTQLMLLYGAFIDAKTSVGVALSDIENLTKAVDVTPTP